MSKGKLTIYDLVELWVVERYGEDKLPEYYYLIINFLESLMEDELDEMKERLEKLM